MGKKGLKVDGLTGACKKLGFSELTTNLLLAMAENNRVGYIDAVAGSYATLMAARMAKEVEGALKGFLKANEKALITYKVDPSIVGGMVVSIGDKFCDMSMSSKLNKYSELIKSAA